MLYKKVSTDLNFVEREKEILDFWQKNEIFKKTVAQSEGKPEFTFYDGPPTANGKPHIGHILTRCIKDLIPRYKTMQGYNVLRKAGWDTHGLPVELEVEKALGLDGKQQIEKYGIEPFIKECKKSVWKYKGEWEKMSDRVGYWADMENPYITYENSYIESVWWSLKEIAEKGLLYKGHKIVPYCPRCGTALSSHEVAQGYKDVNETSLFVKFKVKNKKNSYLMAWTTTPWTLPSNVALCVNAKETYALVEYQGDEITMAKALINDVLVKNYKIIAEMKGKDLEKTEYEPLYDFGVDKKAWYVTCDDYVTLTDGTGIVHIAPAFGEDDARVGKKYNLPFVQMVDERGRFKSETPWADVFVKDADELIIKDLEERGLAFAKKEFTHSYPYCWRCDTPLLYYARSTWFIKMTAVKDNLIKNNRTINWLPENIKEGRMGNFLENVIDWGLSRERYWGTPLPVWECECGHFHVIGSIAELKELGENVPDDIELHKPFIDKVKIRCEKCGALMTRVPEVIDCWYDSGSMPFAQWHYPFENQDKFKKRYPADFISEAIDQTRGWFYTLLAISTLIFDRASFKNCIVLGHVQDKDGQKMSKHKGNVVDPFAVLDKQGADAVRWYFYYNSAPWLPNRFSDEAVSESQRKYMGTLWNTYAFYVLYANIDNFNPYEYSLKAENLSVMDKWILSRLNTLILSVSDNLDNYHITEASRDLGAFVDELSNWYVRRCRERFWGSEMTKDKEAAYMTLFTVLETLSRLTAPFTPFIAESIYQNIVKGVKKDAPLSVHLASFPKADKSMINKDLEKYMDDVLNIVVLGRAVRNSANIKNRQPVAKIFVGGIKTLPKMYTDVIADELNVHEIVFNANLEEYISYNIKPQLKTLGPKYGKLLKDIKEHLSSANGKEIVDKTSSGGLYEFKAGDTLISLSDADILVEPVQKEGFAAETMQNKSVILDTVLTPELIKEGLLRELTSKIQTMRKEADFAVTDHIRLRVYSNDMLKDIIEKNADTIKKETLTDDIAFADDIDGYKKEWNINGETAGFTVAKI
ncbi:MAG: isoleucine--tRNA ligase [Eubacteriales bacterium]